jgi:hypothetical protein
VKPATRFGVVTEIVAGPHQPIPQGPIASWRPKQTNKRIHPKEGCRQAPSIRKQFD